MSPAASTPSTESLFRLGLNDALPISDEATTSRAVSPCRMQLVMVDVDKAGTTTTK